MKKYFIHFGTWLKSFFVAKPKTIVVEPKTIIYHVPNTPLPIEKKKISATKAHFDQRQKMLHNRRHKPSKRMCHIYKTL